jgi:hypothetical protein
VRKVCIGNEHDNSSVHKLPEENSLHQSGIKVAQVVMANFLGSINHELFDDSVSSDNQNREA